MKIYSCKDLGLQITRVYFGYTNHDRIAHDYSVNIILGDFILFIDFYSTREVEGNSLRISRWKVKNCVVCFFLVELFNFWGLCTCFLVYFLRVKLLVCFLFYFIVFFLSSLFVRLPGLQFFSWLHHSLH